MFLLLIRTSRSLLKTNSLQEIFNVGIITSKEPKVDQSLWMTQD